MKASLLAMIVCCAGRQALADPSLYTCKALPATAQIDVSFNSEVSLDELSVWVMGLSCKTVVFTPDAARYATRIHIISPGRTTVKKAVQLFVDSVEATGLVVVPKADSLIVKLGPDMRKACPSDSAITRIDDSHFVMTQALRDAILVNPRGVAGGVRFSPASQNSKPAGLELFEIQPDSIYARLGFVDGDTLTAINKRAIVDVDSALEVYSKLRTATSLEVELVRRSQPHLIVIEIK